MRNVIRSCVVARDNNVLRVVFRREPDPPAPKFPGAGAMREVRTEDEEALDLRAA